MVIKSDTELEEEKKSMINAEAQPDGITIRVEAGSGEIREIVVQKTDRSMRLEDRSYLKYQIMKPKGYEDQEIFHCPDRGLEVLLTVVFMTLAAPMARVPHPEMRA
jgi:hypothetical protein